MDSPTPRFFGSGSTREAALQEAQEQAREHFGTDDLPPHRIVGDGGPSGLLEGGEQTGPPGIWTIGLVFDSD